MHQLEEANPFAGKCEKSSWKPKQSRQRKLLGISINSRAVFCFCDFVGILGEDFVFLVNSSLSSHLPSN